MVQALDGVEGVGEGHAVGELATRIDHVGPTSVGGLDAPDIIDIQITVRDEAGVDSTLQALAEAGYTVCNRLAKGEWVCLAATL